MSKMVIIRIQVSILLGLEDKPSTCSVKVMASKQSPLNTFKEGLSEQWLRGNEGIHSSSLLAKPPVLRLFQKVCHFI